MSQITKKEIRGAVVRAKEMLARNGNPCDTFEGIFNREYAQALVILIALGEQFLEPLKPPSRAKGRPTQK